MAALLAVLAIVPAAEAKGRAFVVGFTNSVATHAIGPGGELSLIGATPTGNTPRSVVVSPNAQYAFVSNFGGDTISAYTVGGSGALTPNGAAVAAGTDPEGMAITPNGTFLYAANQGSNNISGYTISATGTLVPLGTFAAAQVKEVAISGNGLFLYATTDTGVRSYSIDQSTGVLTPIGGVVASGTNPKGIATTPNGQFVYVGNTGSNNVFAYSIGADGSLTSIGPAAAGTTPQTIAVDQGGRFVFAANFTDPGNVTVLSIGADGALSPVGTFPTGSPFAYGVDAAPNGRLYVSNFVSALSQGTVSVFDVAAGGSLTPITGSPFPAGVNGPEFQSIAITPNQGPTAQFSATPAGAGTASTFAATGSTDSDGGAVARYDWDFGDGQTLPNGGPTPTHTYAAPGTYNVTLTVTDDEGCSNTILFTGQTADCNGSGAARSQQTIQVAPGDPELQLSGKRKQELRRNVVVKARTVVDAEGVAKGRLSIDPGRKGKRALVSFRLKKHRRDLEAGRKTKLKPKLSKLALEVASDALREGGKVTAKVKVKATSAGGDTDTAKRKVKLTR